MEQRIDHSGAFAVATVALEPGEAVTAEAGAMVSMSPGLEVQTSTGGGGILKGLKRAALGGESFYLNTFAADSEPGEVAVAPALPGDIARRTLGAETIYLTSGCYLASGASVEVDTKWGGSKTFFSGEGMFLLKVTGPGDLLVASYGAIEEVDLADGRARVVDSGHVVGFTEGVDYEVRKFAGWKSTLLGGEGLVVELTGPGTAWIQTRNPSALVDWLAPRLPNGSD